MLSPALTLLFLASISCEWVEISQQHYKKPIRPAHHHPLLAAAGYNEKVNDGKRIYINHSLSDHWKDDGDKVISDETKLKDRDVFSDRRPESEYKTQVTKDILVIKQKPVEAVTDNTKPKRIPVAGNVMRVRPPKKTTTTIKPLNAYKGSIEVIDISDFEDITGSDISTKPEEVIIVKTTKRKPMTTPRIPITTETTKTSSKSGYENQRKNRPRQEIVTKEPKILNKNQIDRNKNVSTWPSRKPERVTNGNLQQTSHRPTTSPKKETIDVTFSGVERIGTTAYKFPNLGHVKRVQLTSNTTKVTHRREPAVNRYVSTELPNDEDTFTKDPTVTDILTQKIKSTSRKSTTEKYPTKKMSAEKMRFENRNVNHHKVPDPEEVMIEEILKKDEGKLDFKVHKVGNVGTIKTVSTTTPTPVVANIQNSNKYNKNRDETAEIETDGEVLVEDEEDIDKGVYFTRKLTTKIDEQPVLTTFKPTRRKTVTEAPEVSTQIERYEKNPYRPVRPSLEPLPEFVTKEEHFSEDDFDTDFVTTTESDVNEITTTPSQKATTQKKNDQEKTESQKKKNKTKEDHKTFEDPESNEAKPSTVEKLIKFLKTVTDIITRNTRRGVRSKMQYLEDLRDTIVANIEERIEATFPDDDAARRRTVRSAVQAQPRGHVEFPSSESALMTISFLTFAVFLIKLVLQVIQAYKQKTMMMMPTMVAAVGRALVDRRN